MIWDHIKKEKKRKKGKKKKKGKCGVEVKTLQTVTGQPDY